MFIRILAIILFLYFVYKYLFENNGNRKNSDLRKALRVWSDNSDYIGKEANVIALGARVQESQYEVLIQIPTRGIWQLRTRPQVREILLNRISNPEFKHFMDLNFNSNVIFSQPKIEQDKILIKGSKNLDRRHFGSPKPKKW